jgi:hypothetical protein
MSFRMNFAGGVAPLLHWLALFSAHLYMRGFLGYSLIVCEMFLTMFAGGYELLFSVESTQDSEYGGEFPETDCGDSATAARFGVARCPAESAAGVVSGKSICMDPQGVTGQDRSAVP